MTKPNQEPAVSGTTPDENDELELAIEQEIALVEPILAGLFEAAATGKDHWLKKRNLQILTQWLQHVIGMNSLQAAKIEALQEALGQAANASIENRIWTPH